MNLQEKLSKDMIISLKEGKKSRLMVLRMIKAAMMQEVIDHKRELNDELLIEVVGKQLKMRGDSLVEFEKAGRSDLIDKTKEEIVVLNEYLPEQLSEEEVNKILDEAFTSLAPTGPKDMGKVMQQVTPKLKGKTDLKEVSQKIKVRLESV